MKVNQRQTNNRHNMSLHHGHNNATVITLSQSTCCYHHGDCQGGCGGEGEVDEGEAKVKVGKDEGQGKNEGRPVMVG